MPLQAVPYIILLGLLWGFSLVTSRFCVGQFDPLTFTGLRLVLASLGYVLVYLFAVGGRRWPTGRTLWRRGTLLGIAGTAVSMVLMVLSLQYQSSGMTGIVATINPAVTVLIAHFVLPDERLTLRKSIGIALAFAGAVLLAVLGESGLHDVARANPLGMLFVVIAMSLSGAMTVYARKKVSEMDAFHVTSVRMFTAALVVVPLALLLEGLDFGRVDWRGALALGYAAIGATFFAFWLLLYCVNRFGATSSAMVMYVTPVFSGLGGVLLLGERITAGMIVGLLLIVAGISMLNQRGSVRPGSDPRFEGYP